MDLQKQAGALVLLGMLAGLPLAAHAQDEDLAPPPRPLSLIVNEKPSVTVSLDGDSGPVRVTGTLTGASTETLHLQDPNGKPRDASWNEIRTLSRVEYPSEGMPVGSFRVTLVTDAVQESQVAGVDYGAGSFDPGAPGWRLLQIPEGKITLSGAPYGTLTVPAGRISSWQDNPVRGTLAELPAGNVRVEVLSGSVVSLPLPQVQFMQRDLHRGTVNVTLADGQTFSGKLVELPNISITMGEMNNRVTVPLSNVVVLERPVPAGSTLLSSM